MSESEQIEQGRGNKQTLPKLSYQSKNWVMTWNNYPSNVFGLLNKHLVPLCEKYVFGKEVGKEGTPHIQGAFILTNKMRQGTIYNLLGHTFFLDKMKGRWEHQNYCIKDNDYITNQKFKKGLKKLPCEDPDKQYKWQKIIIQILKQEADDRSIYWFKGDGNNGKTTFCKYLIRFHEAIILGGKCADMKNCINDYKETNGYTPELIVINITKSFDKEYVSYGGIEEVKDMCFYSGKYKGGMIDGNPPHLFIFSNEYPNWDKVIQDRWKCYNIDKDKWVEPFTNLFIDMPDELQ